MSSIPLTALYYIVHTTIACSAWRWRTQPQHVADDTLLIKLCLDLFLCSVLIVTHPLLALPFASPQHQLLKTISVSHLWAISFWGRVDNALYSNFHSLWSTEINTSSDLLFPFHDGTYHGFINTNMTTDSSNSNSPVHLFPCCHLL